MKNKVKNSIKKYIIKFRYTKIAQVLWRLFSQVVNAYYPRRLLIKALHVDTQPVSTNTTVFPKIKKSTKEKNVLIIMPFYGNDATGKNIDTKISTLKALGFAVHVVVYNNSPWDSYNPKWDYVYNIKNTNGCFGKLRYDVNNQVIFDGNKIDDWIDDEICQFIAALSAMNNFQIAIVNYVFLSKLCLYLGSNTVTVIDTHDVFAKRNTRMSRVGINPDKFYFSTTKEEEIKGLSRADYIFAIQESEGRYFVEQVPSKVIVQPPIFDSCFIDYMPKPDKRLIVGFMASGHYPNVIAINNFIENLNRFKNHIRLDITGTICGSLMNNKFPRFVNILGYCDSLEDFYTSCDVIVNPDELLSGIKVKCLEALSYGVPLVSTKAAMEGIESDAEYHLLDSDEQCAEFIASLKKDRLPEMALKSRSIFVAFNQRYNFKSTMKQVLHLNEK